MKIEIGRLVEDDDGQYFVIPVDRVEEFWEDHKKAFKNYPIAQVRESGLHYQSYLDRWGDYMKDSYKDLNVLMR